MEANALMELHAAVQAIIFPIGLISKLEIDSECISECEVLDFKENLPSNDLEYATTARDALALHNSYGGFIVFGVGEIEKDKSYSLIGVGSLSLHLQKLNDILRNCCNLDIRLDFKRWEIQEEKI